MGQLAKIEALAGGNIPAGQELPGRAPQRDLGRRPRFRDLDLVTTVEALTHQFVIHRPDALDRDRDRFIDEVTRLVVGYLRPGGKAR